MCARIMAALARMACDPHTLRHTGPAYEDVYVSSPLRARRARKSVRMRSTYVAFCYLGMFFWVFLVGHEVRNVENAVPTSSNLSKYLQFIIIEYLLLIELTESLLRFIWYLWYYIFKQIWQPPICVTFILRLSVCVSLLARRFLVLSLTWHPPPSGHLLILRTQVGKKLCPMKIY